MAYVKLNCYQQIKDELSLSPIKKAGFENIGWQYNFPSKIRLDKCTEQRLICEKT